MESFDFENRCTIRESMLLDYLLAKTNKVRPLLITVTVLAAVCIGIQVLVWLVSKTVLAEDVLRVCFCAVIIVFTWFIPRINARISMFRTKKKYGGTLPDSVSRFGDKIETNHLDGVEQIAYSQIKGVYRLTDSYALLLSKNRILFLSFDGFVKGNFADFKKFLRMKRPDLVIPE